MAGGMKRNREKRLKVMLIGYRATGKSSVGRLLAGRLGVDFIDTDHLIEAQYGPISRLVAEKGWTFFRAREKEALASLVALENGVIATGGGAVLHQDVWPAFKASGLVVWLTAAAPVIRRRLAADETVSQGQRPSLTGNAIQDEIETVLAEREPLYRLGSHLAIDTAGKSIAEIIETIETVLNVGIR